MRCFHFAREDALEQWPSIVAFLQPSQIMYVIFALQTICGSQIFSDK